MKKFTLVIVAVALASFTMAQQIPNWTKTATSGSGGQTYTLHDLLSSGNYVLLDFMASWCGPCQSSTPAIQQLWEDYGEGSGGFYAFAMDVEANDTEAILDQFGQTYGGHYPAFTQCGSDYSFYNANWGSNGIPLFVLLTPNTADPANSTVNVSQVGWSQAIINSIKNELTSGGVYVTGISNNLKEAGINIFPNPATDNFNVYLNDLTNVDVKVMSITGQVVDTYNSVNSTLNINTSNYKAGIYFVAVSNEEGVVGTFKVNVK